MPVIDLSTADVSREHRALLSWVGRLQRDCSASLAQQAARIEALEAETMRLRAALIVQTTLRAQERAEREAWTRAHADLPRRMRLAQCIDGLVARVQTLLRERLSLQWSAAHEAPAPVADIAVKTAETGPDMAEVDEQLLARSVAEADLVICQTGCLSHDAYWRVQGHCRRLGKPCLLVHDEAQVVHLEFLHVAAAERPAMPASAQASRPAR